MKRTPPKLKEATILLTLLILSSLFGSRATPVIENVEGLVVYPFGQPTAKVPFIRDIQFIEDELYSCGIPGTGFRRELSAPTALRGKLSINGVRLGMKLKDVEKLFGQNATCEDSSTRYHSFGTGPGYFGFGNWTIIEVDGSKRVCSISGMNLEVDGALLFEEAWPRNSTEMRAAYPLFAEELLSLKKENDYVVLSYPELDFRASTTGDGPLTFELGDE